MSETFDAQEIREKLNRYLYFDNEVWYYLNACLARIEELEANLTAKDEQAPWHWQKRTQAVEARMQRLEAIVVRVADLSVLIADFDKEYTLIKDARAVLTAQELVR